MDRDEELDTRHTSDEDLHLYAGNEVASAPRWRTSRIGCGEHLLRFLTACPGLPRVVSPFVIGSSRRWCEWDGQEADSQRAIIN